MKNLKIETIENVSPLVLDVKSLGHVKELKEYLRDNKYQALKLEVADEVVSLTPVTVKNDNKGKSKVVVTFKIGSKFELDYLAVTVLDFVQATNTSFTMVTNSTFVCVLLFKGDDVILVVTDEK